MSAELAEKLKAKSRQLGFQLAGITTPDPPESYPIFQQWIGAGRCDQMDYLASERSLARRADPCQILPECRSILVLGIHYSPQRNPARPVAAYAWGSDYHDLLPPRLQALVDFLEEETGQPIPNRWYSDTGPVLERDLARRAGLGWVGKNSMLIHPGVGSYFLLAEILLGIDLPPDAPYLADHCGTCTRCISACPTGCILPDRTLDARRCLSSLTIENKGSIPPELRPGMANWVFGCDVCQMVCPWNRFAPPAAEPRFEPRPETPSGIDSHDLALTPREFNRKFKDSPIQRAKRRGYLRNLAVALGNAKDPTAVPSLARALRDDEALVRQHAAWALGQIGGQEAQAALQRARQSEQAGDVLQEIDQAIKQAGRGAQKP